MTMSEHEDFLQVEEAHPRWQNTLYAVLVLFCAAILGLSSLLLIIIFVVEASAGPSGKQGAADMEFSLILLLFMLLMAVWLVRRVLRWEDAWRADADGISIRRAFTMEKIRWQDVRSARLEASGKLGRRFVLEKRKRTRTIAGDPMQHADWVAFVTGQLRSRGLLQEEPERADMTAWVGDSGVPHLESLEICEARDPRPISGIAAVTIVIFAGWLACLLSYRIWETLRGGFVGVVGTAVLIALVWGAYARYFAFVILRERYVCSDRKGLTVRRTVTTTFVPWSDVEDAYVDPDSKGQPRLVLKTARQKVVLGGHLGANLGLAASIWQHLQRFGQGSNIGVSPQVMSLFRPIPEDLPEVAEWASPPEAQRQWSVKLRRDGITTHIDTVRSVKWDDVVIAVWRPTKSGNAMTLGVAERKKNVIFLPWPVLDRDYARLLLAVIVRLRTCKRPQWVMVPESILQMIESEEELTPAGPAAEPADDVEEQVSR